MPQSNSSSAEPKAAESELFRLEALNAQRIQLSGVAQVGDQRVLTISAYAALSLLLIVAILLTQTTYTKKAALNGLLLPQGGLVAVTTPHTGSIVSLHAKDGDYVRKGQLLVSLQQDRYTSTVSIGISRKANYESRLALLESEYAATTRLHDGQIRAIETQLGSLDNEIVRLRDYERLTNERLGIVESRFQNLRELFSGGHISKVAFEEQHEQLIEHRQRRSQASGARAQIERERAKLLADRSALVESFAASREAHKRNTAALSHEQLEAAASTQWDLNAPVSGWVSASTGTPGQTVSSGQQLIQISASEQHMRPAKLQAILFGQSEQIGFIKSGQAVNIRVAAFPHDKYGTLRGIVSSTTLAPIAPQDLPAGFSQDILSANNAVGPMYRVAIDLDRQELNNRGEHLAIRTGMKVSGHIDRETKTLLEWLFKPLFN